MPPTVQIPSRGQDQNKVRTGEKRSELICRVKYCNSLPDIPFDPKFITYPFESNRFVGYNQTTLEKAYKHDLLTEHDLGVTIDLINPDAYTLDPEATLHPADEKLLEEDTHTGLQQDLKRSRHHAKNVSWLRRTEYISTEHTRFQPQSIDKIEAKVGFNVKKLFKDEHVYMDRAAQIKAIDKTFEDAKRPIEKHYSKPGVTAVENLAVFPDFNLWRYPFAQVIFDSDPAPTGRSVAAQMEEMSQAMIRGVMDESGEQFVAYFIPSEETIEKRHRDFANEELYVDDEEYDYKMSREYNWNVKNKASKGYEENYFMVFRNDGVYYNELETRVRLTKRRHTGDQSVASSRLVVRHRPLNKHEARGQRYREKQLEAQVEEEEESSEEEEEDQEKADSDHEKAEDSDHEKAEGSDKEKAEDSDQEKADSDHEKAEDSDQEKADSDHEKAEDSDREKADSDHEKAEDSDHDKADSDHEKAEVSDQEKAEDSDQEKADSDHEKSEDSDQEKADSDHEKSEDSDKEKADSDHEKAEDSDQEKADDSDHEKAEDSDQEKADDSDHEKADDSDHERAEDSDQEKDSDHKVEDSDQEKDDSDREKSGSDDEGGGSDRKADSDQESGAESDQHRGSDQDDSDHEKPDSDRESDKGSDSGQDDKKSTSGKSNSGSEMEVDSDKANSGSEMEVDKDSASDSD